MKKRSEYTVDYATLKDTIAELKRLTGNSTLEVCNTIRITGDGDRLTLEATDLESRVTRVLTNQCSQVVEGELDTCVKSKDLHKALSGVTGNTTVRLASGDAGALSVTVASVGVTVRLPRSVDPEEFPPVPSMDGDEQVVCECDPDKDDEGADLKFVAQCMSADETRYNLNAAYFDGERGKIVATDGHRLHVVDASALSGTALLPAAAMGFLVRMSNRRGEIPGYSFSTFGDNPKYAYIETEDGWRLITRYIDGQFPEYMQVIWDPTTTKAEVLLHAEDGKALLKALKQAAKFAPKRNGGVRIRIESGKPVVAATREDIDDPEVEVELPLEVSRMDGGPLTLNVNVNYLVEPLSVADGEVLIHVKEYDLEDGEDDRGRPVKVKGETAFCGGPYVIDVGHGRMAFVMPMRM